MSRLIGPIVEFARNLGGPGLLIIAFLDSSFLSLPEINDLLLILMVSRDKPFMIYYATMATLGSVGGCLVLYVLGRRGGEALLRKRFHERHVLRAMNWSQRYGAFAIIVPALLPPPAPFKIFVLLAGVARVAPASFALSVIIGRGIRYFGAGLLAVWYGDLAFNWLRVYGPTVALALAGTVVASGVAYYMWRNRHRFVSRPTRGSV